MILLWRIASYGGSADHVPANGMASVTRNPLYFV